MTDDETLLERVGAAFDALDPVPAQVRDAALAALASRRPGAALAELSADSAEGVPDGTAAGVRREHGARLLIFTGPGVTVEVEVTGAGAGRELAGRLDPPAPAAVSVRHRHGEVAARADRAGHFVVPAVPAGPISLVFELTDASSIVTSWVRL
ncbi:MAG TPA: hypothetical protein VFU43_27175 [Streptosporangiaceae bacterium]|nr:hypothetical protein [Streptosporangiaceae bacterium]